MKKNKSLLIWIVVFALLLVGAYVLYNRLGKEAAPDQLMTAAPQEEMTETTEEGTVEVPQEDAAPLQVAPDFVVYDGDGNEVRLSDFFGTPIVLNFWASWCGPCKMEMPLFQMTADELAGEVQFLMVNMTSGRETLDTAKEFLAESGYTFPVFFDTQSDAAMTYSVYSLPTTYFLDANGTAVAQAVGAVTNETLQQGISMIVER